MSTAKGIAIPPPKKPIQAVGKTTVFTRDPQSGRHTYIGTAGEIELFKREIYQSMMGQSLPIETIELAAKPATAVAKRTLSPATIAKMKAAQAKRQAELRKAKEAAAQTLPTTKAKKGATKEKTMAAGATG